MTVETIAELERSNEALRARIRAMKEERDRLSPQSSNPPAMLMLVITLATIAVGFGGGAAGYALYRLPGQMPAGGTITLVHPMCFGDCPQYAVTLYGSGRVVIEGEDVVGKHAETTIPASTVQPIFAHLLRAHFLDAEPEYRSASRDTAQRVITLRYRFHDKTVAYSPADEEGGCEIPQQLTAIGAEIDRAVDVSPWLVNVKAEHDAERRRIQKELDARNAGKPDAGKPEAKGLRCHMLDGTRVASCAPGDSLCMCD